LNYSIFRISTGRKDISYYKNVFNFLVSKNIKLMLNIGSGEIDRGWISGPNATIFDIKKLLDKDYPLDLLVGIYLLDEPLGWLETYLPTQWQATPSRWDPTKDRIYPKSNNYDSKKYMEQYKSLAPDTTNGNDVTSEGDIYSLYRTDIQLIHDTFGTCIYYLTCLAFPTSNKKNARFSLEKPKIPNPIPKGKTWKMANLSWGQFLYDCSIINVIGLDVYSTSREGINDRYSVWKSAYDIFKQVQPPGTKNLLILQSNCVNVHPDCGQENTCDKIIEELVKDYNQKLIDYTKDNGGSRQFPFQLVFEAPSDCVDKESGIKPCDRGGKIDTNYEQDLLGNYHCYLGTKKCPESVKCRTDCWNYNGGHNSPAGLYYTDRRCGLPKCFKASPNIQMLTKNASIPH